MGAVCHTYCVITRKNIGWWLLAAAALVAAVRWWSIIAFIVLFIAYRITLERSPHATCSACDGAGRKAGWIFGWSHRQCNRCGGQGRNRRAGTVLFRGGGVTWAEQQSHLARTTRRDRPRP
jgi:hypothetical protein